MPASAMTLLAERRRDERFLVAGAVGIVVATDQPDDIGPVCRVLAIDHEAHRLAGSRADAVGITCDLEHRHPLSLSLQP